MAEAPWRQAAVPPPPPGATGHIVPSRLKSEISDRREPPPCVQNAMLTKDKKPFTYTPGGIDLSEIRSPRMARRLERNAMNEGVSSVPQTTHHPAGQLPPSALAAMQPQLSVQVFPTGGIPQPPQGGPPPPPPPPKAPPMKTSPLPTDCYNRPDMTKIIPDNPMSMLRKTSGPVVKQDPILSKAGGVVNNVQKMDSPPRTDIFNQSVDTQPRYVEPPNQNKPTAGVGSIYVPPINQKAADSPPAVYSPPAYYKRQVSSPPQEPPKPQTPDTPNSPKPTLSKAPTPWLTQRRQNSQDVPDWAINDHRVQSPPVAQEQAMLQPREEPQQTKPVRPWQQQEKPRFTQQPEIQQRYQEPDMQPRYQQEMQPRYQQQQQEKPRFVQQQPEIQQRYQEPDVRYQQEMQPRYQQQQQAQPRYQVDGQQRYQQQPTPAVGGARKQIQNRERPQEYYPPERTEVVIVNDPPQIYHHPGQKVVARQSPQNSYQHYKQDDGIRIIPVQIEGRSNGQMRSPTQGANSDARSLNRQLSWNTSPTQSNTFRVLQKITQTDGADDDDQVVIEHSPKMYQQFPQRQTSTDGRKWNQNESDQALMGTFKQVQQQPHANNASGPKVRTIPIQIEGNGQTKNYVPPSEQTVQEPKKYMGSSIPSRSFKILQAMTAPDECVNPDQACENNENYSNDPSSYTQWGFDPNLPPPQSYCFDPYWSYYAQNYYPLSSDAQDSNQNPRITPIPAPWNFYPPYYYGQKEKGSGEIKRVQRTTPLPWQNDESNKTNGAPMRAPTPSWPFYCPNYPNDDIKKNADAEDQQNFMPYPPYWNPYYYNYYYGMPPPMYPPMYSPYPFYPPPSDNEEVSGYSSNEEMAYYGARFASMPPFCNTNMSPRPKSNVAKAEPQPVNETKQEVVKKPVVSDDEGETSDSDAEMVSYEVCRKTPGLQAIRSVSDIKVYDAEDSSQYSDDDSDNTTEENDDNSLCVPEDVIPHQLSVIFEESEKTDSAKLEREPSVSTTLSEGTATIENSEEEDADESDGTVFVKLPLTFKFVVAESQKVATVTVGDSEIVPQTAVRSSFGGESCDKTKTDALFNLENNKIKEHEDVDWWGEISKDGENVQMNELKNSESGIDFWAHLNKNPSTTQIYSMSKKYTCESTFVEENTEHTKSELVDESEKRSSTISSDDEKSEIDFWAEIINTNDNGSVNKVSDLKQDSSSTCSSDSSLSSSAASENLEIVTACNDEEEKPENEVKPLTIQERIKSLQDYVASKKFQDQQDTEVKISIKERISQLQDNYNQLTIDAASHKTNSCSRKSSIKSYEGCSEEEGDSGVTSDVSRHVSEVETDLDFFENRKNQYQRASTHSRLFKLLQDECDCDDEPEDEIENKTMIQRRDCLSLPLKQPGSDPESFSSSGFTSPGSPTINDKILNEIIQNLIMKKQGKVFKNMNIEKLQAAALRILQEDMDGLETLSSSEESGTILAPKKNEITNVPTECYLNFNDYSQYYDSWSDAERLYDGYDIVPSKAFRLLQEHSATNRTGAIAGLLARCPRVLSNKNVQKELMKLIECQNSPTSSPEPEQSPNVSEATSAS